VHVHRPFFGPCPRQAEVLRINSRAVSSHPCLRAGPQLLQPAHQVPQLGAGPLWDGPARPCGAGHAFGIPTVSVGARRSCRGWCRRRDAAGMCLSWAWWPFCCCAFSHSGASYGLCLPVSGLCDRSRFAVLRAPHTFVWWPKFVRPEAPWCMDRHSTMCISSTAEVDGLLCAPPVRRSTNMGCTLAHKCTDARVCEHAHSVNMTGRRRTPVGLRPHPNCLCACAAHAGFGGPFLHSPRWPSGCSSQRRRR